MSQVTEVPRGNTRPQELPAALDSMNPRTFPGDARGGCRSACTPSTGKGCSVRPYCQG